MGSWRCGVEDKDLPAECSINGHSYDGLIRSIKCEEFPLLSHRFDLAGGSEAVSRSMPLQ